MDIIEAKLNALEDIKLRALYLEKRFVSNDPEETMPAIESLTSRSAQSRRFRYRH